MKKSHLNTTQPSRILRVPRFVYRIRPIYIGRIFTVSRPDASIGFEISMPTYHAWLSSRTLLHVVRRCQCKSNANKVGNSAAYLSPTHYIVRIALIPLIQDNRRNKNFLDASKKIFKNIRAANIILESNQNIQVF